MSERRYLPLAGIVAAALFVLAFATSFVPWLTRERTIISSTPTNMPLAEISDVRLRPAGEVCVAGFGLNAGAEALQLVVSDIANAGASQPLRIDVRGPGYHARARLPGGYPFGVPVLVALRAPADDVDRVRACVRNTGRRTISIVGTNTPRDRARVEVRRDGRAIGAQPSLTFVQLPAASILASSGEILERVSAFRPFPAVVALLGLLAVLVIVGVPLAVVAALAIAERSDRDES